MWWRRALLISHVIRLNRRAPRGAVATWDGFWTTVTATGDSGDVLWDTNDPQEALRYLDLLISHADLQLPIVDIGCGNGRFTRALATRFPAALGVDISPTALDRARLETGDLTADDDTADAAVSIAYQVCDISEPGAGGVLRSQLGGDVNVFVRGVFHVLEADARRAAAAGIAALVGDRGLVLIAETNHRGRRLDYLESLGASHGGIPRALAKVIASGLAAPLAFGPSELEDCFPPQHWRTIVSDTNAAITTVPAGTPGVRVTLPGFVVLLAPRSRADAAR